MANNKYYFICLMLLITIFAAAHSVDVLAQDLPPITNLEKEDSPLEADYSGCGGVNLAAQNAAYEQRVVEMVNEERAKVGRSPLKRINSLDLAARYHAADMFQDVYFSHDSYDRQTGNLVLACETFDRIGSYYSGGGWMGENISAGRSTPEEVIAAWMGSEGHRDNILRREFREIGVGYFGGNNGSYGKYWVQNFGTRSTFYPVVINREAAQTGSRSVELYLYGSGTFSEMRLRNDDGVWSSWMPFRSEIQWELAGQAGIRTVWAEMRNSETTHQTSDTIELGGDGFAPAQMINIPSDVRLLYSQQTNSFSQDQTIIELDDGQPQITLQWTLTKTGDWFDVSQTSGSTPDELVITPQNRRQLSPGNYEGEIVLRVVSPSEAAGQEYRIRLTLVVVDGDIKQVYLPLTNN